MYWECLEELHSGFAKMYSRSSSIASFIFIYYRVTIEVLIQHVLENWLPFMLCAREMLWSQVWFWLRNWDILHRKWNVCVAQGWEEISRLHFGISFFFSILFYLGWYFFDNLKTLDLPLHNSGPIYRLETLLIWMHFGSQDLPTLIFYDTLVVTKRNSTYMIMIFSYTLSHTWSYNQDSGGG